MWNQGHQLQRQRNGAEEKEKALLSGQSESAHFTIKVYCRRILSMTPDTLLIEASLTTCNVGVQSSGTLGDLLRFRSWKNDLLKEKGGPVPVLSTLRTYYADLS